MRSDNVVALSPAQKRALLKAHFQKQAARVHSFPASYAQERLWFLEQLEPGTGLYNHCIGLRFERPVDSAALDLALNEMARRHETLRTGFGMEDGQVVQRVLPAVALRVEIEDLRVYPAEQIQAKVPECSRAEARRPFDLREAPLLRARLLLLSDQEQMLLLTLHHLVTDGWSAGVIFRELGLLYEAQTSEKSSALGELPIQYVDYAVWQRGWLQGEVLEQQLNYWREQLRDVSSGLELPCDKPRPAVRSYQGARQPLQIAAGITEGLRKLGQREGTTLFMTLLAAFQVLLHRYSGQEDVVVGTLAANRTRGELESLIGCFVNTLALRTKLAGDPTFQQVLQQVRQVTLEAYAHQDVPFEKLVRELKPERDLSRLPLFQVLFQLQDNPTLELGGLRMAPWGIENGTSLFDLTLELAATGAELIGHLEYNTDLFEAETIARMAANFEVLLTGIVADPQQRIGRIPLLTPAERARVLVDWNDTRTNFPDNACIHEIFESQVEARPDHVALTHAGRRVTYRELNMRANQLAHRLQAAGVVRETLVGVGIERSPELCVALLGILKAGAAYLPLDPRYPRERLAFILADTQCRVALTAGAFPVELLDSDLIHIRLDADLPLSSKESSDNIAGAASPNSLAYVIYTSGSTGDPKGVFIEHCSLVNHSLAIAAYCGLQPMDRVLQFASINFDTAAEELFPTWFGGGTVVMRPDEIITPRDVLEFVREERIAVMNLPTYYWHEFVSHLDASRSELPHTLRLVIIGGEPALPQRLQRWREHAGGRIRCINTYGVTEATITTTAYEISKNESIPLSPRVPIGRPIANTQVYILDKHLQPVPVGVTGELHIGGSGLARGYLNRPELTAARFVHVSFDDDAGVRLYKTGDLARHLPDGNVEIIGRMDQQVKLHGFRIELGEIEAALVQHPAVHQAVVLAAGDGADARLIAYVVNEPRAKTNSDELGRFLRNKLPYFMLPTGHIFMDALPLNANGKIDRKALRVPGAQHQERPETIPPRAPVEQIVAGIWADALGVAKVGLRDSFFKLGGHSLLAAQVASRISSALQVNLSLRTLIENPTVESLVKNIENCGIVGPSPSLPPVMQLSRTDAAPLSVAQESLWRFWQYSPKNPFHNMPFAFYLEGDLDFQALEKALELIGHRHEILRTSFAELDGQPVQVVAPSSLMTVQKVDLSSLPVTERETEALRLVVREAWSPFDLSQGPLWRVSVAKIQEQEHILSVTLHHAIGDGQSVEILLREIGAFYESSCSGTELQVEDLPAQYSDFAFWERSCLNQDCMQSELDYWRGQLGGSLTILNLPFDRSYPPARTYRMERCSFAWPENLIEPLGAIGRREGATLFMCLTATLQLLLAKLSGQTDIRIGTVTANRQSRTESLIGLFANTLILRSDLSGNPAFLEVLGRVRATALQAYAHQELPFDVVIETLRKEALIDRKALCQVMLLFEDYEPALALKGLHISKLAGYDAVVQRKINPTSYDLVVNMSRRSEGVAGHIDYNCDVFDGATIETLLGQWCDAIHIFAAGPDMKLSQWSLHKD